MLRAKFSLCVTLGVEKNSLLVSFASALQRSDCCGLGGVSGTPKRQKKIFKPTFLLFVRVASMGRPPLPPGADKASRTRARKALWKQQQREKQKTVDAEDVPQLETDVTQCHRTLQWCVVVVLVVLLLCCSSDGFPTFATPFATLFASRRSLRRSTAAVVLCSSDVRNLFAIRLRRLCSHQSQHCTAPSDLF